MLHFFTISFSTFPIGFLKVKHTINHILGKVGPIDLKQKGNAL